MIKIAERDRRLAAASAELQRTKGELDRADADLLHAGHMVILRARAAGAERNRMALDDMVAAIKELDRQTEAKREAQVDYRQAVVAWAKEIKARSPEGSDR